MGERKGLGLAPLAVVPDYQRQGAGAALVREGLQQCRQQGAPWVVVLGHPEYYPRFGFIRASTLGLRSIYTGAESSFMVLAFDGAAFAGSPGLIRYCAAFESI